MADQRVNIKVTAQGAKKAQNDLRGVSGAISKMGKAVGIATTAYFGARGLIEGISTVVSISSQLENVEKGFNNLARASGFSTSAIDKLRRATDGTMDSMDLMTQANNMMLLGITDSEDQMAEMFDVAQRLASALGKDTAFGVESLVTGLGRQSKLMLDNLGIMFDVEDANKNYANAINKTVSELTEQERKQAFVNEAMAQANKLVDGLGEEQLSTADSILQMKTALTELAVVIGDAISPAVVGVSKVIVAFANGLSDIINFREGLAELAKDFKVLTDAEFQVMQLEQALKGMTKQDILNKAKELGLNLGETADASKDGATNFGVLNEVFETNAELAKILFEAYENAPEAVNNTKTAFDEYLASQKELLEKQEQEKANVERLKKEYPKLAESLGLVKKASEENTEQSKLAKMAEDERFVTSLSGARSLIKSLLAEATARLIAKEMGKGVIGLITGSAGAIAVSSLFDKVIPKFAQGGIVQGDPSRGDVVPVMATAGELILNQAQQENLVANSGITINISAPLVDETVVDSIIPAIEKAKRMNLA
jgi:hypothetical protein